MPGDNAAYAKECGILADLLHEFGQYEDMAKMLERKASKKGGLTTSEKVRRNAYQYHKEEGDSPYRLRRILKTQLRGLEKDPEHDKAVSARLHREVGCFTIRDSDYSAFYNRRYRKAVEHGKTGAELGDAASMYYLAIAYETGRGVKKDPGKAEEWFHAAKEAGYEPNTRSEKAKLSDMESLDSFQLGAEEEADLKASKLSLRHRISHSLKRNAPLIKRIALIAGITLAVTAVIAALATSPVFFPGVMIPIWIVLGVLIVIGAISIPAVMSGCNTMNKILK